MTEQTCTCTALPPSRDPAEPHIAFPVEWEQDPNCPTHGTEQIIPSEEDPLLGVGTVARMFDVNDYTVREWIRQKKVKATKVMGQWRIQRSECIRIANQEYGK